MARRCRRPTKAPPEVFRGASSGAFQGFLWPFPARLQRSGPVPAAALQKPGPRVLPGDPGLPPAPSLARAVLS
eukprot:9754909-Alexandrium_andersonii.AAC.1